MEILVVGGGGREHALVLALKKSPQVSRIHVLPGNGGIAQDAVCVDIRTTDIPAIVAYAQANNIGFAVVAPDDPLVLGAVDALEAVGIPCFGPNKRAAIIEGSKAFSKDLMRKYRIPTAGYSVFDDEAEALACIDGLRRFPVVIKADGLALGKGVIIAQTRGQAMEAVRSMMSGRAFGDSGKRVVIEQYLQGPEVSVLVFTDGKTIAPMVSSMDHKRALDGDLGPNTGGMGVVAPNPYYTQEIADACMKSIFIPTVNAMNSEERTFKGCLYFGLMLTDQGPKVIEYNCRFGDPETQAVLPLLKTDLLTVMQAVAQQRLAEIKVENYDGAACCVVLASGGYPGAYQTGKPITIGQGAKGDGIAVYHAGTKALEDGTLVTNGGRVLGVSATAPTLRQAIDRAYLAAADVKFEGVHMRHDIGQMALRARQ